MMKVYKITTKGHWGEDVRTWNGSEDEHVEYAEDDVRRRGTFLDMNNANVLIYLNIYKKIYRII